jgi:hypothetical protein
MNGDLGILNGGVSMSLGISPPTPLPSLGISPPVA